MMGESGEIPATTVPLWMLRHQGLQLLPGGHVTGSDSVGQLRELVERFLVQPFGRVDRDRHFSPPSAPLAPSVPVIPVHV
jgi:hypothetical protein